MSDFVQPNEREVMDRWLPFLSHEDCDAAIRLVRTMAEARLMLRAEAAEWSVRLLAWKQAHTANPAEA